MSGEKAFKISVVIPVYNTDEYLEETITSITDQTIGFEQNVQLILVNNASEDKSGKICKRYLKKYPDNVVYIKFDENRGPCPARNAGMKLAKGKYINFLDSDDKWERTALKRACRYFDKHYDEIDLVSGRIRQFDARENNHYLDWKYFVSGKEKIVDILEEPEFIQLHIGDVIFKTEAAKKHSFDERLYHSDDKKYVTEVLLEKNKYALLRNALFFSRIRSSRDSVSQNASESLSWYLDPPALVFGYLFESSKKAHGNVLKYLQYLAMDELRLRLAKPLFNGLSPEEIQKYREIIISLIKDIDDQIILDQKRLAHEFKIYALSMKYDKPVKDLYSIMPDGSINFEDLQVYEPYSTCIVIGYVNINDNLLTFEGRFRMVLPDQDWRLAAECGDKEYDCELFYLDESEKRFSLGDQVHEIKGFRVQIPLSKDQTTNVSFKVYYKDSSLITGINYAFVCKLTNKMDYSYLHLKDYVIKPIGVEAIEIHPYSKKLCRHYEWKLDWELFFKYKERILAWRLLIRLADFLFKHRKPIWLFLDRFEKANDNGEVMFNYVNQNHGDKAKTYFVIAENSNDYERIKKTGRVIKADTKPYRLFFALSDKIISSQSFYSKNNTFCDKTELLQDLFHYDFVYLQHGVIKDNHADTQSKFKKSLDMFVTSAEKEKDSIVKGIGGNYLYDESVVKVTGLARYDLIDLDKINADKKVLLAPTWRREGVGAWDENAQTYKYSEQFKNTVFFKYYNSLINDPKLLKVLKEKGYTMCVRFHPRTIQQASDFTFNDLVKIELTQSEYVEEMKNTSLLITDYSSIAFDYSYAYIPCVYSQFDVEDFYSNHAYRRGYFDYEKDGFGEVCYDYDSTLETIVKLIENDCKMEDKYRKRVDEFFAYHDHKNCERIYNEIIKLDEVKHSGS